MNTPRLIGLDWGTSSLRAYLLGATGAVLDSRARPWGILRVPDGDFAAALAEVVGDWHQRWPDLPLLAAGMIGSRQGWREVPYVDAPARATDLAAGVLRFACGLGDLHLVPGVLQPGARPNVMRGEETQLLGAMAQRPALAADSLVVLPGTHSKWVRLADGHIGEFSTHMTGELFAVLREHSILGRPARDADADAAMGDEAAFLRGLQAAAESGAAGVSGLLFTARSLFLTGELSAGATLDYLSGLLIGEELRSALSGFAGACPPLALLGDAGLCQRYALALRHAGVSHVEVLDDAASAGLWLMARAAGLVTSE